MIVPIVKKTFQSPYDFIRNNNILENSEKSIEFLFYNDIGKNMHIVFYENENQNIGCVILKKTFLKYKVMKISSEISSENSDSNNFLFGAYDNGENWVSWNIINDQSIKKILINGEEACIEETKYDFRICYLVGGGIVTSIPEPKIIY